MVEQNIIVDISNTCEVIDLGKQGENKARKVIFDLSKLIETYGDGTATVVLKRTEFDNPYAVLVETTEQDKLEWIVTDTDTNKVGFGLCEVRFYVGETLAKSTVYKTQVRYSIHSVLTQVKQPMQDIIDKLSETAKILLNKFENIDLFVGRAEKASTDAESYKNDAEASKNDAKSFRDESEVNRIESSVSAAVSRKYAELAEAYTNHPPIISDHDTWLVWNGEEYVDTGLPTKGEIDIQVVGAFVEEYLRKNPFVETDPTVPQWAKQQNKPSYDVSEITNAVDVETLEDAEQTINQNIGRVEEIANSAYDLADEANIIASGHIQDISDLKDEDVAIRQKISDIEMAKFPNVTIFGQPTIQMGQISNFNRTNYCQFPFVVNFQNQTFQIDCEITTGNEVTQQHNILDSEFGLAFAVRNSRFVIAISTNGTNWNIGEGIGTHVVLPNTTYRIKMVWNKTNFVLSFSQDGGQTYVEDITKSLTEQPYPKQMFIGITSDKTTVFNGSINLNHCSLIIANKVVWQGMDDVGLATRMAIDMSNIDESGIARLNDLVDVPTDNSSIECTTDGVLRVPNNIDLMYQSILYGDGESGYRKYRNGMLEQWGVATTGTMETEFTMHQPHKDMNFSVFIEPREKGNFFHYAVPSANQKFKCRTQTKDGEQIAIKFQWRSWGRWK